MSHLTGTAYPAEESGVILTVLFLGQILPPETKTGTAWDTARKKFFEAAEKHLSISLYEEMAKEAEICCFLSPTESLCLAGRNRGVGVVTSNAFPKVLSCAHREKQFLVPCKCQCTGGTVSRMCTVSVRYFYLKPCSYFLFFSMQIQNFHRQQGAGEFGRYRLHARGLGFKAYFCIWLCSFLSNFWKVQSGWL